MSTYLFQIFGKSRGNENLTTILTCLDINPRFFSKILMFKSSKNLLNTLKLFLTSSDMSYKSK